MQILKLNIRDENVKYLILKLLNAIVDEVFFHFVVMKNKEGCDVIDAKIDAINEFVDKMSISEAYHEFYAGLAMEITDIISENKIEKKLADFVHELLKDTLKKVKISNTEEFVNGIRDSNEVH